MDKSVDKKAKGLANLKPFKPGQDKRRGRGPLKGAPNAGRPPKAFKELMAELATGERTVEELQRILKDGDHPKFAELWKEVTAHAHGKPTSAVDVTTKGESLNVQRITINGQTIEF